MFVSFNGPQLDKSLSFDSVEVCIDSNHIGRHRSSLGTGLPVFLNMHSRKHTKGLLRIHCLEDVCVGLLTPGRHVNRMSATEISAPRSRFLDGLCKTQGYNVVSEGERITVAFEPWALEQVDAFEMPCLRLDFRQVDGRIVLQRFTVESGGEEQVVNLEAARDALQAWMDSMAD